MSMSSPLQRRPFVRLGVALLAAAGCGLIDPNITAVGFDLPTRSYEINATGFNLPADNSIAIPCTTNEQCVVSPFVCDNSVCTAVVPVTQSTEMNLGQEAPELGSVTGTVDISIDRIGFAVTTNTLNVDLPPVLLYMAPSGVTDPADPRAMLFGTVPSVPAGQTTNGQVQLSSNSDAVFKTFTHDLSMPFSFIASTTVKVASGAGVPSGRVVFSINGRLSASL
jgi:hypothetical protein